MARKMKRSEKIGGIAGLFGTAIGIGSWYVLGEVAVWWIHVLVGAVGATMLYDKLMKRAAFERTVDDHC